MISGLSSRAPVSVRISKQNGELSSFPEKLLSVSGDDGSYMREEMEKKQKKNSGNNGSNGSNVIKVGTDNRSNSNINNNNNSTNNNSNSNNINNSSNNNTSNTSNSNKVPSEYTMYECLLSDSSLRMWGYPMPLSPMPLNEPEHTTSNMGESEHTANITTTPISSSTPLNEPEHTIARSGESGNSSSTKKRSWNSEDPGSADESNTKKMCVEVDVIGSGGGEGEKIVDQTAIEAEDSNIKHTVNNECDINGNNDNSNNNHDISDNNNSNNDNGNNGNNNNDTGNSDSGNSDVPSVGVMIGIVPTLRDTLSTFRQTRTTDTTHTTDTPSTRTTDTLLFPTHAVSIQTTQGTGGVITAAGYRSTVSQASGDYNLLFPGGCTDGFTRTLRLLVCNSCLVFMSVDIYYMFDHFSFSFLY